MKSNHIDNIINSKQRQDREIATLSFVEESNRIEGITRPPTKYELYEHERFVQKSYITMMDLECFVQTYQQGAELRSRHGLNVVVGGHTPPPGGMAVPLALQELLDNIDDMTPYQFHVAYETLHPFTDGNGRSGRAMWAWQMLNRFDEYPRSFLYAFYYQALDASRN